MERGVYSTTPSATSVTANTELAENPTFTTSINHPPASSTPATVTSNTTQPNSLEGELFSPEDSNLTCASCGEEFLFTAGEKEFYVKIGNKNVPKRCQPCRDKRIMAASQNQPDPTETPATPVAVRRNHTQVQCAYCGVMTTVPFMPTRGKPVYCHTHFKMFKDNPPPSVVLTQPDENNN